MERHEDNATQTRAQQRSSGVSVHPPVENRCECEGVWLDGTDIEGTLEADRPQQQQEEEVRHQRGRQMIRQPESKGQ